MSPTLPQPLPYGPPLGLEAAKRIMAAAEAEAAAQHWPMVIAIVDSGANLLMLHRGDQAHLGSIGVAQSKAQTAVNFRNPTKLFAERLAAGVLGFLSVDNAILVEGGYPIVVDGKIVGGIGVSGMLPGQDSQVALAGLAALI